MTKLSAKTRKSLPSSDFAEPKQRKYPIEDKAHARNALARVAQNGSATQQAEVRRAVHDRYPEMGDAHHPGQAQADGTPPSTLGKKPTRRMMPSPSRASDKAAYASTMSGMERAMAASADKLHPVKR